MVKMKWGIVTGIASFVLAFLLAIFVPDIRFGTALLRAIIFMVVGFGVGTGIKLLIDRFIPDLLTVEETENPVKNVFGIEETTGTKINITVGEDSNVALPEGNINKDGNFGNITDLLSGKFDPAAEARAKKEKELDQNPQTRYTQDVKEEEKPLPAQNDEKGGFNIDFSSFTSSAESSLRADGSSSNKSSLWDSLSLSASDIDISQKEEALPERKITSGNKPQKMEGDFNPKEIAAGIRTVLEKDKRG